MTVLTHITYNITLYDHNTMLKKNEITKPAQATQKSIIRSVKTALDISDLRHDKVNVVRVGDSFNDYSFNLFGTSLRVVCVGRPIYTQTPYERFETMAGL